MSTPSFDGEVSRLYGIISEQHKHENGPWKKILQATESALDGLKGPLKLLDLASGPGEPGLSIARSLPDVEVVITDISSDQVALAAQRAEGLSNVTTQIVDIADLSSFEDNSFDAVTVSYGYMFCSNKQQAFNEAYRVLKPGGAFIATYWKVLHTMDISAQVLNAVFEGEPVPSISIEAESLSEDGLVQSYVEKAGFPLSHTRIEQWSYPFNFGPDKDFVFSVGVLPIHSALQEFRESESRSEEEKEKGMKRAKKAFWDAIYAAPYVSEDSEGQLFVNGNTYEMIVSKK